MAFTLNPSFPRSGTVARFAHDTDGRQVSHGGDTEIVVNLPHNRLQAKTRNPQTAIELIDAALKILEKAQKWQL